MPTRTSRRIALCLLAVAPLLGVLQGCKATYNPGWSGRASIQPVEVRRWPARRTSGLLEVAERIREDLAAAEAAGGFTPSSALPTAGVHPARSDSELGEEAWPRDVEEIILLGRGVLLKHMQSREDLSQGRTRLRFASFEPRCRVFGDVEPGQTYESFRNRAVHMYLFEPLTSAGTPNLNPRGLAVYLHSIGPERYERPVVRGLREQGWAVLVAGSRPEFFEEEDRDRLSSRERDPSRIAWYIARAADERLAIAAYAIEGAREYLAQERPDIPQSPMIGVGMSAGALALPAVASLTANDYDAIVLVGGGADLLTISQTSTLSAGGVRLRLPGGQPLDADTMRYMREVYLRQSTLDPYHTARALTQIPTLVLHATKDSIVPSSNGEELWRMLGRPDRVTYPTGHELLFFLIGSQVEFINSWIESTLANGDQAG